MADKSSFKLKFFLVNFLRIAKKLASIFFQYETVGISVSPSTKICKIELTLSPYSYLSDITSSIIWASSILSLISSIYYYIFFFSHVPKFLSTYSLNWYFSSNSGNIGVSFLLRDLYKDPISSVFSDSIVNHSRKDWNYWVIVLLSSWRLCLNCLFWLFKKEISDWVC